MLASVVVNVCHHDRTLYLYVWAMDLCWLKVSDELAPITLCQTVVHEVGLDFDTGVFLCSAFNVPIKLFLFFH